VLFFANAKDVCLEDILEHDCVAFCWVQGVFVFYAILTVMSGMLLLTFRHRLGVKKERATYISRRY